MNSELLNMTSIPLHIIWWRVFISWLNYHKLYGSFYFNINNIKVDKDYFKSIEEIKSLSDRSYILWAFRWSHTKEGDEFWRKKHNEWKKFYTFYKYINISSYITDDLKVDIFKMMETYDKECI